MSSKQFPPYFLQELPDITEAINYPVKDVQRIKYTCFDVSKSLIAFGATSGGIYIFNRTPCEFVQLIPNKDGTITRLAISPTEKHIAFANGRGIVSVTECDQSHNSGHMTSKEHQGNEVTTMAWSGNNLFTGDDVGRISVLQLQSFITKTMFTSTSQTIMNLDSRICQLDVKGCMLLVSTLTRCYICDTVQEQYRQIGQKLRDGEYGACFLTIEQNLENGSTETKDFSEAKQYKVFNEDEKFAIGKGLENVLIYCARPSSRLWEATVDGTVRRTHQFKHVLAKKPMKVITEEVYNSERYTVDDLKYDGEGLSVNFPKIYNIKSTIFSYRKDGLYFLDVHDESNSVWYDEYKDVVDCKIYEDSLYLRKTNGSLVSLKFMKIDKFLVKCYLDGKYLLCAEVCALYRDYLMQNLSSNLCILVCLREKVKEDILLKIECLLVKLDSLKSDATQNKSGIYVLDNNFKLQSTLDDSTEKIKQNDDKIFTNLPPEALQTLKDLSVSVTDKLSSSKKILKEKWDDFEGKMKHLNNEKQSVTDFNLPKRLSRDESAKHKVPIDYDNDDIIYTKESSQKAIDVDNNIEKGKVNEVCKALYQHFRINLVHKETEKSNLISLIESYACDISQAFRLMISLEQYCLSVGALEEAKFIPNYIFLDYLNLSIQKDIMLESIIKDEVLYKYFVDSCISVNMKTQKLSNLACDCGFPLPYNGTNQTPAFSELIDTFIEKQWASQTREQCYEICKRMPYLWRKILYLRRNEDLLNVLRLLLQMLDEGLLHSFLPQFTLETWDRAIQLYATLCANICLNCNNKFDHILVKEALSWDDIGALILKSVGGRNAVKLLEKHASLIGPGELSMKFYHTSILVSLFEMYDATITSRLTAAVYTAYEFENSRHEIYNLLRSTVSGHVKNTALPLLVAAKTIHWGLSPITERLMIQNDSDSSENEVSNVKDASLSEILIKISDISNGVNDCVLCGLPLNNEVLIKDGGLWVFKCGHIYHGACLDLNKLILCPACTPKT